MHGGDHAGGSAKGVLYKPRKLKSNLRTPDGRPQSGPQGDGKRGKHSKSVDELAGPPPAKTGAKAMSKAHSSQLALPLGVRPKHRREPKARLPKPWPYDDSTKPTAPSARRGLQAENRKFKIALYEGQRASHLLATSSEQVPEDTKTRAMQATHGGGASPRTYTASEPAPDQGGRATGQTPQATLGGGAKHTVDEIMQTNIQPSSV